MKQTYVSQLQDHVGQEVTVRGWLYNSRIKGKIVFLLVRDGTGTVQSVVSQGEVAPPTWEAANQATQESSLSVTGTVRADARAPGGHELSVKGIEVHQLVTGEYPITPKEHGVDFLMRHRHLWLRSKRQHAILRVRATIVRAIRDYFDGLGFLLVDAPIFTPAACEGTTTLFEVGYFDEKAYLTQSGQLYMEAAAMAHGKVYCFGPTFRAEKSKTRRHLTEFWMVEPEVAYAELDDVMELAQGLVCRIVGDVLARHREDLAVLERDPAPLSRVVPPFPRISYDEAVRLLAEKGHVVEPGNDFGAPDETAISEHFDRPVLVHRYPAQVKAFYMKPDPADPTKALCVDMIAPEGYGEIVGGGQRADSLLYLEQRIAEHRLPKEAFEWYLDLRKYGSVPHGGFGLGVERTVAWICGIEHVRETIPFPRMLYKIYP
ncbi:MAG: asparagine--tRNA ligase [Planctomycetes bacterium]|nr:asparagine--tRNA ligase [Planctomycetota bacterium]